MLFKTMLAVSFGALSVPASAVVMSGDIAIIGHYMDGNGNSATSGDAFSWVVINNVGAGEIIYFSDSSYRSGTSSFLQEGLVRYTVPAGGLSAGTVMSFAAGALPSGYEDVPNTAYSSANTAPSLRPTTSGDQLVAFQDNDVSNSAGFTGLWAVNNSSTTWGATGTSPTESDLYPGMVSGVNALALGAGSGPSDEFDNVRYVGPASGTPTELLNSIRNLANWERTDSGSADPVTWVSNGVSSFTVVPEPSSSTILVLGAAGLMFSRKRR